MKKYKKITLFILFMISICPLAAQYRNLFFMESNPAIVEINPAAVPFCEGYLSIIPISSVRVEANYSSFAYNDFIHYGSGEYADSLIFDFENIRGKLRRNNFATFQSTVQFARYGLRIKDKFFTLGFTNKMYASIGFPKSLLNFTDGNWQPVENSVYGKTNDITFEDLHLSFTNYYEFSFTFQKQLTRQISLGVSLKYLNGLFNLETEKTYINLKTSDSTYNVDASSDIIVNSALPFNITYNEEGRIDDINLPEKIKARDVIFKNNHGGAIDIAMNFRISNELKAYASILDLGFIRWGTDIHRLESYNQFTYTGVDASPVDGTRPKLGDLYEELSDSIQDVFKYTRTNDKYYITYLAPKVYIGATYKLLKKISVGGLVNTTFHQYKPEVQFTGAIQGQVSKYLSASATYSVMNNTFTNFGAGVSLELDYFHLFVMSDNLYGIFAPHLSRNANILFGTSIVFGRRKLQQYNFLDD